MHVETVQMGWVSIRIHGIVGGLIRTANLYEIMGEVKRNVGS